jgi:hypothetical protein
VGKYCHEGMLRHVALVRTDISEEPSASVIRMTRVGKLGTMLAITSNRHMLQRNTKYYFIGGAYVSAVMATLLLVSS